MKVLQETIRNLQTQLMDNKTKERDNLAKISDLETKLKQANVKELLLKTKIVEACKSSTSISARSSDIDDSDTTGMVNEIEDEKPVDLIIKPAVHSIGMATVVPSTKTRPQIDLDDAKLIGLVSTFLVVHPFGASLDYVYSYVQRLSPHLRPKELEEILCRYNSIFTEEVTGIGAKIERKWKFCGFDTPTSTVVTTLTAE